MSNARLQTESPAQGNGKSSPEMATEAPLGRDTAAAVKPEHASAIVLVVDDDRAVRHTIRRIFEETTLEILTAETAEEGLKRARQRHPDVILLDVMLPDRSGLEVFGKFHELDQKVPVIF